MIARRLRLPAAWSKMPIYVLPSFSEAATLSVLRFATPAVLALLTTLLFDRLCWRRGLLPPGFGGATQPGSRAWKLGVARRSLALTCLWGVLWMGVFSPLATLGQATEIEPDYAAPYCFLAIVEYQFRDDAAAALPNIERCEASNPPGEVASLVASFADEIRAAN